MNSTGGLRWILFGFLISCHGHAFLAQCSTALLDVKLIYLYTNTLSYTARYEVSVAVKKRD